MKKIIILILLLSITIYIVYPRPIALSAPLLRSNSSLIPLIVECPWVVELQSITFNDAGEVIYHYHLNWK